MKVESENYRGIEFVRISKLPEVQRDLILQSIDKTFIIKILRNEELLTDCIQYTEYLSWFDRQFIIQIQPEAISVAEATLKLAV